MAKISKYGGPTDRTEVAPVQHALSRRPQLGVSKPLVGGNFTRSTESESKKDDEENQSPQLPAQTTDNPSNQQETESSTAPLTDGSTPEIQSQPSAKKTTTPKKSATKKTPRATDVGDEFDEPVDLSGHEDFN